MGDRGGEQRGQAKLGNQEYRLENTKYEITVGGKKILLVDMWAQESTGEAGTLNVHLNHWC